MTNFSVFQRIGALIWAAAIPIIGLAIYAIKHNSANNHIEFTEFYPYFVKNNCDRLLYTGFKGDFKDEVKA